MLQQQFKCPNVNIYKHLLVVQVTRSQVVHIAEKNFCSLSPCGLTGVRALFLHNGRFSKWGLVAWQPNYPNFRINADFRSKLVLNLGCIESLVTKLSNHHKTRISLEVRQAAKIIIEEPPMGMHVGSARQNFKYIFDTRCIIFQIQIVSVVLRYYDVFFHRIWNQNSSTLISQGSHKGDTLLLELFAKNLLREVIPYHLAVLDLNALSYNLIYSLALKVSNSITCTIGFNESLLSIRGKQQK